MIIPNWFGAVIIIMLLISAVWIQFQQWLIKQYKEGKLK